MKRETNLERRGRTSVATSSPSHAGTYGTSSALAASEVGRTPDVCSSLGFVSDDPDRRYEHPITAIASVSSRSPGSPSLTTSNIVATG